MPGTHRPDEPLLILGASVRAAAFSALRAGITPVCADLFADADLGARCHATAVSTVGYPHTFSDVADALPTGPWMYTGAMENHPDLVARLSAHRPLWGNDGEVLTAIRDPTKVGRCLADAGLPHPEWSTNPAGLPTDGSWLQKPLRSANGNDIVPVGADSTNARRSGRHRPIGGPQSHGWPTSSEVGSTNSASEFASPLAKAMGHPAHRCDGDGPYDQEPTGSSSGYYQKRINGLPCSAIFVGHGTSAALLGVTRQLVGETALGAKPFAYCGSIGLLRLDATACAHFDAIGRALTESFGLRGLFGVDCIVRDGVPWPVEVNPRYTASVEVIEHATGIRAIELHRHGCTSDTPINPQSATRNSQSRAAAIVGKAVLYAPHALIPPTLAATAKGHDPDELPTVADIPQPEQVIRTGQPMLTVFASARSVEACRTQMLRRAADLYDACRPVIEPTGIGV